MVADGVVKMINAFFPLIFSLFMKTLDRSWRISRRDGKATKNICTSRFPTKKNKLLTSMRTQRGYFPHGNFESRGLHQHERCENCRLGWAISRWAGILDQISLQLRRDRYDIYLEMYIYILIQDEGSQGAKYFELSKPLTNGRMTNCCEGLVIWVSAISIFDSLGEQQLRGKLLQCCNCYTCNWIPIYDELSKYVEDEM